MSHLKPSRATLDRKREKPFKRQKGTLGLLIAQPSVHKRPKLSITEPAIHSQMQVLQDTQAMEVVSSHGPFLTTQAMFLYVLV